MNTMWRATVVQLLCAISATIPMTVVWFFRAPVLVGPAAAVSLGFAALLLLRNLWTNETLAGILFILINLTLALVACVNHDVFVRENWPFEPFVGIKIVAIIIPLACPPKRWSAWISLALLAVIPLVRYYTWDPVAEAALGIQEPYVTVFIVVTAGFIFHYRLTLWEIRDHELETAVRARALQRFAHVLIGAQHLINTPLQKIEIQFQLIASRDPNIAKAVASFEPWLKSIRRISQILSFADGNTPWESLDLPANADELELEVGRLLEEFQSIPKSEVDFGHLNY